MDKCFVVCHRKAVLFLSSEYTENIILAGLWYGPAKPPMKLLLEPLMNRLEPLTSSGMTVDTPEGFTTMMGIFDLPAKAAVLYSKQFNGEYGCSLCTHPGQCLSSGARVYLPQKYDARTHTSVIAAAKAAQRCNSAVERVKGISPLAPYIISIPIDYMHAVLRRGSTYAAQEVVFISKPQDYLGRAADAIDDQLMKQHPPHEFSPTQPTPPPPPPPPHAPFRYI